MGQNIVQAKWLQTFYYQTDKTQTVAGLQIWRQYRFWQFHRPIDWSNFLWGRAFDSRIHVNNPVENAPSSKGGFTDQSNDIAVRISHLTRPKSPYRC